jgi:hypothetical protein
LQRFVALLKTSGRALRRPRRGVLLLKDMGDWLYAIECVVLPCSIGAVMFGLFDLWDRRRRAKAEAALPTIEYFI